MQQTNTILIGDSIEQLKNIKDETIDCCVTSPPYYGLRDYGVDGQIGLEESPQEYIEKLVSVFREVKRVLKSDGTLWVNIGDSYAGSGKGRWKDGKSYTCGDKQSTSKGPTTGRLSKTQSACKPKDMIGIPWMLAFALREDGWYLRQDIIWAKPNPMPESVKDRCTKSHEYIFLFSKSPRYYFDAEAIAEPVSQSTILRLSQKNLSSQKGSTRAINKFNGNMKACAPRFGGNKYGLSEDIHTRTKSGNEYEFKPKRNKRDVWTITTKPFKEAHFAVFPEDLIEPCILGGSREGGTVLDPFFGSGTTGVVAIKHKRKFIGIELNPEYVNIAKHRIIKCKEETNIE